MNEWLDGTLKKRTNSAGQRGWSGPGFRWRTSETFLSRNASDGNDDDRWWRIVSMCG